MSARRTSHGEPKSAVPFNQYLPNKSNQTAYVPAPLRKKKAEREEYRKSWSTATSPLGGERPFRNQGQPEEVKSVVTCNVQAQESGPVAGGLRKMPGLHKDDLAQRKIQGSLAPHREAPSFIKLSEITEADLETWERLKVSGKMRDGDTQHTCAPQPSPEINAEIALRDDFASRRARAYKKVSSPRQKFVHFGPVTEIDQQTWKRLSIGQAEPREDAEAVSHGSEVDTSSGSPPSAAAPSLHEDQVLSPQNDNRLVNSGTDDNCKRASWLAPVLESQDEQICTLGESPRMTEEVMSKQLPQDGREENEVVAPKDPEMAPKVERSEEYSHSLFGPRTPVSDDAESTSMFDMRCEEEAAVLPHSRARQEQLQLINNQLREEDDKWQDDLARWKSRRRSASQDLIKKEEERKKMEKLLAGEYGTSERRKSIKTYREIVQEKERRERELHEAYKNAQSQEEAESILQQYIERFTISEAVLERLEMPKILERSHSTEPNLSSFLNDPSPMKYLRQQSLPPPKFTATVETTIAHASVPDTNTATGSGSPSKTVTSKAVPMLTPKPYSQPKNSQEVLKTFKVDGKISMNGETVHGDEEEKEKEDPTVAPAPPLTKSQMFEGVARALGSPLQVKQDSNSIEINIRKPNSVPQELTETTEEMEPNSQEDENDGEKPRKGSAELASSEAQHFTTTVTRCSPTVALVEFSSSPQLKNDGPEQEDQKPENEMSGKVELVLSQKVVKPKSPEPEATLTFPFLDKMPETNQLHLPNLNSQADSPSSEKSPVTTPFKFWAWDPEEERRRQEKWQQEQERLLQERKIIEDTVVPFTVSSSSADQLSTSSSITEGSGTMNKMDLSNCHEEERERRQKKSFQEDDSDILCKTRESGPLEEKGSLTQGLSEQAESPMSKGSCRDHQLDTEAQDPPQNQQTSNPPTHMSEDVKPKTLPLDKSINHQMESPSERRKKSPQENFQAGPWSPSSPTPPGQSPNRSISGKKLCSSCRLALGKGAAMIIESLDLYFHIQCFRCGICRGQLGDAVSGTDVRIRNGLLNCNDCYLRSRSAGQPTTL
uniref:LIM zinc-binding domain-containing protein n=1 Tax=Castor canadensis TaxID=51338 RepID=A0A8C0ZT16_CASCN